MSKELFSVELGRGLGVIDLGATPEEVIERLKAAGIELEADEEEPDWLYVDELEAELKFKATSPPSLYEIVTEEENVRFGSQPVIGQRLHTIVDLLQVPASETQWRIEREDTAAPSSLLLPTPTDEGLLSRGTLWIPSLGVGLTLVRGEISTLRLRKPDEAPQHGLGPFTDAQRELSRRSNLSTFLSSSHDPASRIANRFQMLCTVILAVAMGLLVWRAIDYQRRWDAAPVVEGDVVAVNPGPPDPFPSDFTINYHDQTGAPHQIVLHQADVYVVRGVGDKVEIRYLPEAPDKPMGPARIRDAAFLKYTPWGIGFFATYVVLQALATAAAFIARRANGTRPQI